MSFKRRIRRWRTKRKYPWWSADAPSSGDRPVVDVASEADPMAPPEPLQEPALTPKPMRPPAPLERPDDDPWLFQRDADDGTPLEAEPEPEEADVPAEETPEFRAPPAAPEDPALVEAAPDDVDLEERVADVEATAAPWTDLDRGDEAVAPTAPAPDAMAMREPAETPAREDVDGAGIWDPAEPAPPAVDQDLASPPEEIAVPEPEEPEESPEPEEIVVAEPAEREEAPAPAAVAPSLADEVADLAEDREPVADTADVERLEGRLAALEARVGERPADGGGDQRIEALERRLQELAAGSDRVSRIEKAVQAIVPRVRRLDEVRRQLVEVSEGLRGADRLQDHVRELGGEIAAIRAAISKTTGRTKGVDELDERTRGLDSRLRQVEDTRPRLEQMQRQVRGLEGAAERIDRLELAVRGLERTAAQVEDLEERVASVGPAALRAKETEDAVRTVVARVRELMKLSGRVAELERRPTEEPDGRLEELRAQVEDVGRRVEQMSARFADDGGVLTGDAGAIAERLARAESDLRGRMSAVETWMRQMERSIVARLDDLGGRAPADAGGATLQDAIAALRTELDVLRSQGARA